MIVGYSSYMMVIFLFENPGMPAATYLPSTSYVCPPSQEQLGHIKL